MASSEGSEVSSGNTQQPGGFLAGLGSLVIDYGRARYIDSERRADDDNIPDQNDLIHGTATAAARDSQGGAVQQTVFGINPQQLLVGSALLLVSMVVLKALKVG